MILFSSRTTPGAGRLGCLALTAFSLVLPLLAGEAGTDLAQAELRRRAAAVDEAQVLLKQGDQSYEAGKYGEAVAAYRGALDKLPAQAPVLAELRAATVQRLSQASVERAKELRRMGDGEQAKQVVEAVLAKGVAPDDIAARAMHEELLDPIRTNPAASPEHSKDIDEVRRLLYTAEGAYDLGKFEEAEERYEDVLRIDRTNTAARRGMERVAAAKSSYAQAASDHTRAALLGQVDQAWELPVAPDGDLPIGLPESGPGPAGGADLGEKMASLIIPLISLDDVSLTEAIEFLRAQAVEQDQLESNPLNRGVNMVMEIGGPNSEIGQAIRARHFSINLRNVPFSQALQYICDQTGTRYVVQQYAVAIRPMNAEGEDMMMRTYRVPPDFLSMGTGGGESSPEQADPFATPQANGGGLLSKRLTAQEVLSQRGISFPEGSSASFLPTNSTLRVVNTRANQELIQQIVDSLAEDEPTSVVVEVRILRTAQNNLEELGFDWLLGDFGLGGNGVMGGNALFLDGGTQGNGGNLGDVATNELFPHGITAGNRSGAEAFVGNSIDRLIQDRKRLGQKIPPRAPGILWLNGALNNTNVTMLMRGLDQKKGVELAGIPSVTTRSGQTASVRVVREFIYPTEYEPPEIPTSVGDAAGQVPVTPANPSSFEMRETGMVLEVLPTVSSDKWMVDVSVKPKFTEFDGFINYGSPILAGSTPAAGLGLGGLLAGDTDRVLTPNEILMPVFSTISTETSVSVADGSTIVIGGLLDERVQNVEDKTPVLGSIPIAGRLFQTKASMHIKTALIILVNVKVIDGAGRPFH